MRTIISIDENGGVKLCKIPPRNINNKVYSEVQPTKENVEQLIKIIESLGYCSACGISLSHDNPYCVNHNEDEE